MNDQDLERELRSQRSPREDGYSPTRLPMNVEDGTPAGPRRSIVPRAALFTGAALAGALAVAVVTGILSGPRPDVGSNASPSAQASSAAVGDCAPSDVVLSAEPWGGAAGSRGTVVTVALAAGHDACTLHKGLAAQVADADGGVLVTTSGSAPGGSVALADGASFTIGISWSNWCAAAPAAPVTLSLRMSGWDSFAPVAVPAGQTDPVPPCMGSGQPSVLSWTGLEPQQ